MNLHRCYLCSHVFNLNTFAGTSGCDLKSRDACPVCSGNKEQAGQTPVYPFLERQGKVQSTDEKEYWEWLKNLPVWKKQTEISV